MKPIEGNGRLGEAHMTIERLVQAAVLVMAVAFFAVALLQ
jgi:hypothetical protein